MASELKVNKISPESGTTLTLGDTGDTINFGSGVLPNFENLTVTGDLTVDTNSLKVDSTNNYVGIGTATPSVALDVVGAITASGNITGTLATAAQPNITSVGTLSSLSVSGNITGTLATAAQPNITSLGTLTSATISGDLTVDTNTLYVDSTNNRVGVRTSSPTDIFQIDGPNSQLRLRDTDDSTYVQFSQSAGKLVIRQNTLLADHLTIDSSGRVGIGTSSPTQKLHVVGGNGDQFTLDNTGQNITQAYWKNNGTDKGAIWALTDEFTMYGYSGVQLKFYTNASERMRIDTSGNVGIGNTLYALSSNHLQILFGGIGSLLSGTGVGGTTEIRSNSYYSSANQHIYQVSDEASRYKQTNGTHNFDVAPTGTAGGVVTWTTAMSIDNSGNVIANSGSLNLVGTNTQIYASGNGNDIQFKFNGSLKAAINNGGLVSAGDGSNATPGFRFTNESNTGMYRPSSLVLAFVNGGSEKMRIQNNGRIGIGTSSPNATLDVSVDASSNIRVGGAGGGSVDTRLYVDNVGNGGSGRGVGMSFRPSGSSNSVEAVKLIGYQQTAASTANNAKFAIQVANSSGTLTERVSIDNVGTFNITGSLTVNGSPLASGISFDVWVLYNGSTQSVINSSGVSSVTRVGNNQYRTNFSSTLSTSNYLVTYSYENSTAASYRGAAIGFIGSRATTSLTTNAEERLGGFSGELPYVSIGVWVP